MKRKNTNADRSFSRIDNKILPWIGALLNTRNGVINISEDKYSHFSGDVISKLSSFIKDRILPDPTRQIVINPIEWSTDGNFRHFLVLIEHKDQLFYRVKEDKKGLCSGDECYYFLDKKNRVRPVSIEYLKQGVEILPFVLHDFKIKEDKDIEYYLRYSKIKELGRNSPSLLYKYLDLESAIRCLLNNNIMFVEPNKWEDKYEDRFYSATYPSYIGKHQHPSLYACCFTTEKENEAPWKIYSYGKVGLGSHCVEFEIDANKFRNELIKNNYYFYESFVLYKDEYYISTLHDPASNPDYNAFFHPFSFNKYLNLLRLKRTAFSHEKEIRIFALPNSSTFVNDKVLLNIGWNNILKSIRIGVNCSSVEKDLFKRILGGINPTWTSKTFYQEYDIYKKNMPTITIK